ncbi:MAG: DEAD/DEAH box helicase [Chloroflexota bacterium]|nr:DEAD/DEAH box helicase [Chloroflexota bacterium]
MTTLEQHESIKERFRSLYPFALDRFQEESIEAYLTVGSVLVAAPTGTGKTVVAEFGVHDAWLRGHRVIYTTPIKALSNQKYRDFRQRYGEDVGLLTGDVIENREGRILVMTTEVLRNMLLQSPWEVDDVACVVFDEVHYLADPERGTTWEEAIILCPDHVQVIALSATVSNASEIAEWMSRVHRPTRLVTHLERAVPLSYLYFVDDQIHPAFDARGRYNPHVAGFGGEARARQRGGSYRGRRGQQAAAANERAEPTPPEIVARLRDADLLPAIYFRFSRRDCQAAAELCASTKMRLVRSSEQAREIEEMLTHFLDRLLPEDRELEQVKAVVTLARKGIGFHHAGLLPVLKQLVEELFNRTLMSVVFATDTLALGVNMPARSVVIGQMSKFDGQSVRPLRPNEFQQMAGRAGRRGIDTEGYVLVPYSPWVSFGEAMNIATGELYPVESTFALRYNTVLNLWDPPRGERVLYVLRESLMQFQMSRKVRELSDEMQNWQERLDAVPRGCLIGYPAGEELLGEYEELNHNKVALKRKLDGVRREQESLRARLNETPWQRPTREALRKLFRALEPGVMLHTPSHGWGVYAGRGADGSVRILIHRRLHKMQGYAEIDYLPSPDLRVALPPALLEAAALENVSGVAESAWHELEDAVEKLDLPDLREWASRYRERLRETMAPQLESLRAEEEQTRRDQQALLERIEKHPCEPCPVRKQHRNNLREAARLLNEKAEAERELERQLRQEDLRAEHTLRGIAGVLHNFGYLQRGEPTAKTDLLANVFDTNGLIICEMIARGLIDGLNAPDLAEVFSWFAYDRDRQFGNRHVLPQHLVHLRRELGELEEKVLRAERRAGYALSEGYNAYFFGTMRAWCNGVTLADVLEKVDLSEGDLVLTFNKAVDLMRQVREMLRSVDPDSPLVPKLEKAMRLARRGIIEQSYAVGFGIAPPPPTATDEDVEALIASGEEIPL